MKKFILPSLFVSMAFFLFSCGSDAKEAQVMSGMENANNADEVIIVSSADSPLVGKNFGLIMEGTPWSSYAETVENVPYFVISNSEEGTLRLSGNAGCNNIIGSVNVNEQEGTMTFMAGSTMMACSEERMQLEFNFLNALTATQNYMWSNDILVLMDNSGNVLATFMPY